MEQPRAADKKEQKTKHPYAVGRVPIPDPEYMSEVPEFLRNKEIPGFPTTTGIIGEPGSGKSNVWMYLLLNFWRGFFDIIYLFGPTVKSDKMYTNLDINDNQIVTDQKEIIPKLHEFMEEQKDRVTHDASKAPKVLFHFEDFTSYRNTIQTNPQFLTAFNAIRHHKASATINAHKVTAIERTVRMNLQNILIFPVNKTEIDQIYKDWGPKGSEGISLKDFYHLCEEAWTPDDVHEKPFLYINKYQPMQTRYRKCFTQILQLSYFRNIDKRKNLSLKVPGFEKNRSSKRKRGETEQEQEGDGAENYKRQKPDDEKTLYKQF